MSMKFFAGAVCLALSLSSFANAADWPVWRGLEQNSTTVEEVASTADLAKTAWQVELGKGYSAVSIYKGRLLTAGNKEEQDTIYCLDAKTGKEIWKFSYPCKEGRSYSGPRATPVTDGRYVFMLSREGHLTCLDFKIGTKVWQKNVMTAHAAENLRWGFSGSVAMKGDNVYINAGEKGMAFSKRNGKAVWPNKGGAGGYATPIFFDYNKQDYVAMFGAKKFYVIEEKTGKEVASIEWITSYNINAADPIVTDNGSRIFISSAYKRGGALLKFDGKSLTKIWENANMGCHFSTPVLHNGTLYGSNGNTGKGKFAAIDYKTGALKWQSKERFGSPLLTKSSILYLDERGKLMVVKPNPAKLEIVKSQRVLSKGKCWTMPVLSNGILYCRNDRGTLVAIKVK